MKNKSKNKTLKLKVLKPSRYQNVEVPKIKFINNP